MANKFNLLLKALSGIKELAAHKELISSAVPTKSSGINRTKALELALVEQRRDYDILHGLHEGIKVRMITFLAAALGILAFLYGGKEHVSLKERLFIPDQPFGVVFYVAGALLLLGAVVGFLIAIIRVHAWQTAFENDQEEILLNDYERYLNYMHKRYLKVSRNNGNVYEKRRFLLNNSFVAMLVGATILLLIKTFGG